MKIIIWLSCLFLCCCGEGPDEELFSRDSKSEIKYELSTSDNFSTYSLTKTLSEAKSLRVCVSNADLHRLSLETCCKERIKENSYFHHNIGKENLSCKSYKLESGRKYFAVLDDKKIEIR
jgi:hypothetical protein